MMSKQDDIINSYSEYNPHKHATSQTGRKGFARLTMIINIIIMFPVHDTYTHVS